MCNIFCHLLRGSSAIHRKRALSTSWGCRHLVKDHIPSLHTFWWRHRMFIYTENPLDHCLQPHITVNQIPTKLMQLRFRKTYFSSSSILLTDIYKGWSKSQHIITNTNIVNLTGYLKHAIDDAMAYQAYIQSDAGDNDTANNQFERISPCGDCQGSGSSTDSCRIDNQRHPIIDLKVAATAPSSQCRIKVKNVQFHTTILRWRGGGGGGFSNYTRITWCRSSWQ